MLKGARASLHAILISVRFELRLECIDKPQLTPRCYRVSGTSFTINKILYFLN
jgi:hypothetical protein